MLRTNCRTFATLAGVVLAAQFALADGSVNLPLRGKDTVAGTLRPAGDEEDFLCDVPQGAALAVSLKGRSPHGPAFNVALEDGAGPVAGAAFVTRGSGMALPRPFAVAASGRYRIRVTGDYSLDGDYELKVSWKTKTAWTVAGGPLAAAATDSFTFGASAGAGATIDVRPAARSPFAGEIVAVTGPGGPLAVPGGTTSHLVLTRLPATGDYTVQFRNAGPSDGTWTAKAKLKPPPLPAGRIDIRDGRLTGPFGGDHTVYGSVLGPSGGTLEVSATFGPLDGTAVSVPSGVLPGATILTVSAAPPIAAGSGNHPAGPAVEFGPPGTVFDPSGTDAAKAATITIPFDPSYFPSGTDSLVIFVRSSGGAVSPVPRPYTFGASTVSFTTSHFSSYQASSPDPRPLSGDFLALQLKLKELPGFEGQFGIGMDRVTTSANGATLQTGDNAVHWIDNGPQLGSSASLVQDFQSSSLDVTVQSDQSIVVVDPSDPSNPTKFRRGASDDVLVAAGEPLLLLRRAGALPTAATVAGRWHFFHEAVDTRLQTTQPPGISLEVVADGGELTLVPDGTVNVTSVRGFDANTQFPTGTWQHKAESGAPSGVTWNASEGQVQLRTPDHGYPIYFTAVLDGDVLVGYGATYGGATPDEGPATELFVLVRASSNAKLSKAAGDYFTIGAECQTADAKTSGQMIDFRVTTLLATILGSGGIDVVGAEDRYSHDGQGLPSQQNALPVSDSGGRITLKPDGSFTSTDGSFGAFSPGGDLFVRAVFDGTKFGLDFGTPLVLNPR